MESGQHPINIASFGLSRPTTTRQVSEILELEAPRVKAQLDALSPAFRQRLMSRLGLDSIVCEVESNSRERGRAAARQAYELSGLTPNDIGLIIDYSTFASDASGLWSLGHDVKEHLHTQSAFVVGARGSGCCGLHVAFRVAQAFFASEPRLNAALLVASDRAPDLGRACLPISIMSDAASALVVTRVDSTIRRIARVHAVELQSSGRYVDVLGTTGDPPAITIDSGCFERTLLPLHFVTLNRVLMRSLESSHVGLETVSNCVYPNTTELDRESACRALRFSPDQMIGPGPANSGHAFANDLIVNARQALLQSTSREPQNSVWLAAGSGFTWGAAVVSFGSPC